MKKLNKNKLFGIRLLMLIVSILFLLPNQKINAQNISNNDTPIYISSGTTILVNTINNDNPATIVSNNAATIVNNGTLNIAAITNDGLIKGDGIFNSTSLINTGTTEGTGTFNIATITNDGLLQGDGIFNVTSLVNTGTTKGTGTFNIATITNEGELQGEGVFNVTSVINTGTIEGTETFNVTTLTNEGTILAEGTYNITGDFISTGTFFSGTGTVNMVGTAPQLMELGISTFNNLTIDNATAVTLSSTETVITDNFTVNSGKVFKIEADKNLTVTGTIINNADTTGLILKSNASGTASLLHNTADVPVTVQRYISGAAEDWHFLSPPVSNQNIGGSWNPSGTFGNGTGYDLYIFDEPTPCWTYQLNTTVLPTWPSIHPTSNFVTGRGYLYSTQAPNPTKEFIGLLNNGNISYPITSESLDLEIQGFNLIGNPYPSSIDWKATSGWSRENLISSGGGYDMWIWNQAVNNYGIYNSVGDTGTNGVSQYIAPAQGYFIRAVRNGSINISNAVRVNDGASNWLKNERNETNNLKIGVMSNAGHGSDEVLLQFGSLTNEDGAIKFFSQNEEAPSLYLKSLTKDLSVRYLTNTDENSKIPLHFLAGQDGNYELSVNSESALFDILLLEDKKTEVISDLKINTKYEFTSLISDAADRFVLHFKDITEESESLPAAIFYDGNEVNVDLTMVNEETDIKVFDMLGRLLLTKKGAGKMIHRFKIQPKHAVYIVVATSKEKSTRKVILVY